MRTFIERLVPDRYFGRKLDEWKALRAEGWEVVVLIEERVVRRIRRTESVVAFGYLPEDEK